MLVFTFEFVFTLSSNANEYSYTGISLNIIKHALIKNQKIENVAAHLVSIRIRTCKLLHRIVTTHV
jgi:hypothetical protein